MMAQGSIVRFAQVFPSLPYSDIKPTQPQVAAPDGSSESPL